MSQEYLSKLSREEIKKMIHNLTVKKSRLKRSQEDPEYDERERKRKREVYKKFSKSRIQTQMKWNKANRVKTRKYNKKSYEKHKDHVLQYQHEYYAKNKKEIRAQHKKYYYKKMIAARRKKK